MSAAHQPIWKLDTMFLVIATVALIFSWMAQSRSHDAAASADREIVQLSSAPSAALQP